MNILCIVDKYFPENSANTLCVDVLMKYFKEKGHHVDFLSLKTDAQAPSIVENNGDYVLKFDSYMTSYLYKHNMSKWAEVKSLKRKAISGFNYLKYFYRKKFKYNQLDCLNYKNVINLVKQTNREYDCIFSCCSPFQLHFIAVRLLKVFTKAKWYPIFFDPFVFNSCQDKWKLRQRKKMAEKTLSLASACFMVRGIVENNKQNGYDPTYHEKVIEITIPALIDRTQNVPNNKNEKVELTYAGMFYENIRNPKEMFKILSKLGAEFNINIMGQGCTKEVNEAKKLFVKGNLNLLGQVPREECIKALLKSDVLINLGNSISSQTPSKILEYIGFGKPIINFYFIKEDTSLYYLKNYPLSFNLNLTDYKEDEVENLIAFCRENKGKSVSYDEIKVHMKEHLATTQCEVVYKQVMSE